MENRETKPTLSLAPPVQESGDEQTSSSDEEERKVVVAVLDSSMQISSSNPGNGPSETNPAACTSGQELSDARRSENSSRNPRQSPPHGTSGKETMLGRVPSVRNSHRVLKRKKDSATGSAHSHCRPREVSPFGAGTERSNATSTFTPMASAPLGTRIPQFGQQGSCVSSQGQGAYVSFDSSLNGNLRDSFRDANAAERQPSVQSDGGQSDEMMARRAKVRAWGNQPLAVVDNALWEIMEREKVRQWRGIELIASENFASQAVIEALGSHLTNKYSEGLPWSRYYGGNEYIDMIETLCISRALAAFHLDPKEWGVNVQPYSCSSANFAVYTALLQPKDRIMGLDVPSGGHVSHGYYTASGKKVSGASIFFESLPFKVNPQNGLIDFDSMEKFALNYRPKILICGGSAYPREWDYARFRNVANKCGALLMCDMAQISGLIAAQECANPFDFCDLITTTTHKSLRGPRGGMIFYRKGVKPRTCNGPDIMYDFEDRINFAVHPTLQGGPHNNHIAALAVALKQVATPEYQQYIRQVKKNAQALACALIKRGCVLVSGGTDNHLLLWDLRDRGLTGNRFEKVCEMCHMTLNKNAVFGDGSHLGVGGVRIGTPAMTSRGCIEADFEVIADFLMKAAQIAENIQKEHGKLQKDFVKALQGNREIIELRNTIEKFASTFEMPGFEMSPRNVIK